MTQDTFHDDYLNIKPLVQSLANIILKTDKSTVFSVTAPFGIGKTFFCGKLKNVLDSKTTCIYYNAWENDFYPEPLIPLICEISNSYPKLSTKLKNLGISVLSTLSFNAQMVNIDPSKGIEMYKHLITGHLKYDYQRRKEAISNFKKELEDLIKKEQQKPLVLIIDELDRCRPDYAVNVLETIKHFFNIDNVVFVLAIDEQQLKDSVKTLYGTTNFDGYIRKFIDYSFSLPTPDTKKFAAVLFDTSNFTSIIDELREHKRLDIYSYYGSHYSNYNKIIVSDIAKISFTVYSYLFGFTPRKQKQVFDKIFLLFKALSNEIILLELLIFLTCLYEYDKVLFEDAPRLFNNNLTSLISCFHNLESSKKIKLSPIPEDMKTKFEEFKCFNYNRETNIYEGIAAVSYIISENEQVVKDYMVQVKCINLFNQDSQSISPFFSESNN